jgi:hypothetical protein
MAAILFFAMSAKVTAIIYILICFEVGILLVILPWTPYWDDNFFLNYITGKLQMTGLATFLQTGYVRGAVSALGIVNILAGLRDMFRFRESVHAIAALDNPQELIKPLAVEASAAQSDHRSTGAPPQS